MTGYVWCRHCRYYTTGIPNCDLCGETKRLVGTNLSYRIRQDYNDFGVRSYPVYIPGKGSVDVVDEHGDAPYIYSESTYTTSPGGKVRQGRTRYAVTDILGLIEKVGGPVDPGSAANTVIEFTEDNGDGTGRRIRYTRNADLLRDLNRRSGRSSR